MKGRWKHPVSGMRWYKKAKAISHRLPKTNSPLRQGPNKLIGTSNFS